MRTWQSFRLLAALLALALLAATLAWRIPFMLWDHLDFAPLYAGWQSGASLSRTIFWHNHGGHLHAAAYGVLLLTTWLSHGQTWLDCFASWVLLVAYAATVLALCRETLPLDDARARAGIGLIAFLALYPGHLANLQWGWQVAVFLCLLGAVVAIRSLSREDFDWRDNAVALCAAAVAALSFGIGLAIVPIALLAIVLRDELRGGTRLALAAPWLLGGLLIAYALRGDAGLVASQVQTGWWASAAQLFGIGTYALNFIGAGIARFAPEAAPWLALFAILSGARAAFASHRRRSAWPWIGLMLFALIGSMLTALGRVAEGPTQAFASRYVSFSTVFWLGWLGVCVPWIHGRRRPAAQWAVFALIAAFALGNAVAMAKRAARLAHEARLTAATLCATYPDVDDAVLKDLHYAGADAARERLRVVHALGFPPFDACRPAALPH